MKIVSACLAGINCRYNGSSKPCEKVLELIRNGEAIPLCPEQLGGLSTPRTPCEQRDNKIINKFGVDLTDKFMQGVAESLKIADLCNCDIAILKSKSPSCGYGKIPDGTFSGRLIEGNGIFAQALYDRGIKVITEEDLI
jgi:uncharacterized protein YbbK (DUF523 family)